MSAANMALIAAAQQQKLMQQEEEEMTKYSKNDLNDWEFKIIRANFKNFKNSYELNNVLEEESKAGWELVEKFDDHRLRLKRRVSERKNDQKLTTDPYRTVIGTSEQQVAIIFIAIMFMFITFVIVASSY